MALVKLDLTKLLEEELFIYFIVLELEPSSSLIRLQVIILRESLLTGLFNLLQRQSELVDQLSTTFEKLPVIVLPYSLLLELLCLIKKL